MFISKPRVPRPYKIKQDMKSMHELNTYKNLIWLLCIVLWRYPNKNWNRNYEVIREEQNSRNKILFFK